ncbi:hypothetical protein H7849_11725 [Alloacidobacterium dinghuense]|uniref:Uncharacterized protein n=1 Tax=Alloacidobacterium dinghuense TaxID=2763107 RepID=A0A7G8BPM4_9BACT|nr:hypothetical protein [Alloacidobacterium dinghuense]QNI34494.1 hypothetical protein H7849_11725 [Alloacidobacterium dinghuense]
MKQFLHIATEIGALVEKKNAAYGSSFAKSGAFLRLLYPDGIRPEQFDDALLITRVFDKLQRIATDRDALGESPYRDIAGYGILGASMHESKLKEKGSNGGRKPHVPTRVSKSRMRQARKKKQRPLLQRQLPDEGLQGDQRTEAANLPALRQESSQTWTASGPVEGITQL